MRVESVSRILSDNLRSRLDEIEVEALNRFRSLANSEGDLDPEYRAGLRAATAAALSDAIDALEGRGNENPTIPAGILSQARLAARRGVPLDTVLRRCLAGHTLLSDYLVEEAGRIDGLSSVELKRLLGILAGTFDHLIEAVSEEYRREATSRSTTSAQKRTRTVEKLLDGELVDTLGLAYEFDGYHVGLVASGADGASALRALARAVGCSQLVLPRSARTTWAWFGSLRRIDPRELKMPRDGDWHSRLSVGIGEPALGLSGWRLTHRQAKAAATVASTTGLTRYADVALLASVKQDDVLAASLKNLYLTPLEAASDGGETLRETLRAYFATGRNISSAAAALKVHRRTVANRICSAEQYIGRHVDQCALDLELALRLDSDSRRG